MDQVAGGTVTGAEAAARAKPVLEEPALGPPAELELGARASSATVVLTAGDSN